ncbi:MAG: helix-turn-helix domain-containing protein [Bacillota bacterium]
MDLDKNHLNALLIAKIHTQRLIQNYTLRDLAKITGLSHGYINKIEQGVTNLTESSLTAIQKALNFSWDTSQSLSDDFSSIRNKLYKHLVYAEYSMAYDHANKLYNDRHIYLNSPLFIDYYLIMVMYIQHAYRLLHLRDEYVDILMLLETNLTEDQYELYALQMSMYYHYARHDVDKALNYLNQQQALAKRRDLLAINYFVTGMVYGSHYKTFKQSTDYINKAHTLFQEQNNFIRLMHVKTVKQSLLVYLKQSKEFLQLNYDTTNYAKIKNEPIMHKESLKTRAFYYMMQEQFEESLRVLNQFEDSHGGDYYFIKTYVLYRLAYHVEALHLIQSFKHVNPIDRHGLYALGLEVIEHSINKPKNETLISMIKTFADKAIAQGNYGMIRVSYYFVSREFESLRRYKECFEYSHKLLKIIQTIVGREEDHNEARTL